MVLEPVRPAEEIVWTVLQSPGYDVVKAAKIGGIHEPECDGPVGGFVRLHDRYGEPVLAGVFLHGDLQFPTHRDPEVTALDIQKRFAVPLARQSEHAAEILTVAQPDNAPSSR